MEHIIVSDLQACLVFSRIVQLILLTVNISHLLCALISSECN